MKAGPRSTTSARPKVREFLVATGNPHKVEAIRGILADLPIVLSSLDSHPRLPEPVEDGDSFLANALIKSRYYCEKTGLPALADDSGLEVDALDGRPGVHSARYAGENTSHSEKMVKLLEEMHEVPEGRRSARFRCVAAVTFPDGREFTAEGSMEGVIGFSPQGEGGFGYDPIVYLPQLGCTVAELTPENKDSISHRGQAFRALFNELQDKLPS